MEGKRRPSRERDCGRYVGVGGSSMHVYVWLLHTVGTVDARRGRESVEVESERARERDFCGEREREQTTPRRLPQQQWYED